MYSTSETGHAKNIANFKHLISFCRGYDDKYQPSAEHLKIENLENMVREAESRFQEVVSAKAEFDSATDARRKAFQNIKTLSTRIINSFAAAGADELALQNAKSFNQRIQGGRRKKNEMPEVKSEGVENNKNISASQQSYDRIINHFAGLTEMLRRSDVYNPNEEELKISTLERILYRMQEADQNHSIAYAKYSNAMILRNQALYSSEDGIVNTAKLIKKYIKSVFGAVSPQYKQISKIEFRKTIR